MVELKDEPMLSLQHLVHRSLLLPLCRDRIRSIKGRTKGRHTLKYLALLNDFPHDVLYLYDKRLLPPFQQADFSAVTFLARDAQLAAYAASYLRRAATIPGAFIETVLAPDVSEGAGTSESNAALLRASARQTFDSLAPFDVVNLDFASTDLGSAELKPSRLLDALRRVAQLQAGDVSASMGLPSFSLCLSVRVPTLDRMGECEQTLRDAIVRNLQAHEELAIMWAARVGVDWPAEETPDWIDIFTIAWTKTIIATLGDSGWSLDPEHDLQVVRYGVNGGQSIAVIGVHLRHQRHMSPDDKLRSHHRYLMAMQTLFGEQVGSFAEQDVTSAEPIEVQRVARLALRLSTRPI